MHDIVLIIRREFRERVASRSFVIGTLLFPLLMAGLIMLPRLIGSRGTERTLAVVNDGPAGLGEAFAATLGSGPASAERTWMLWLRMNAMAFLSGDGTPPPVLRAPAGGPPRPPRPPPSEAGPRVQT